MLITCLYFRFVTDFDYKYLLPNQQGTLQSYAVGLKHIKMSHLTLVANCIDDYDHSDMAAILVFLKYFSQLEVFYLLPLLKINIH